MRGEGGGFKALPQDRVQQRFTLVTVFLELLTAVASAKLVSLVTVFLELQDRVQQHIGVQTLVSVLMDLSQATVQQHFAVLTLVSSRTRGYGVLNVIPTGGERSWMTAVSTSRASYDGCRQKG